MKKIILIFLWTFANFSLLHSKVNQKKTFHILPADNGAGMFALFSAVLGGLHCYEQKGSAGIHVNFTSGLYLDTKRGLNWWEYYFEPINIGNPKALKQHLSIPEICYLVSIGFGLSRQQAFELIQKYIIIKASIQKKVNRFVKKHFKQNFIIGVHHRGTDKKLESPLVSYEKIYKNLQFVIRHLSQQDKKNYKIYVATDDQKFLDYLIQLFPPQKLIYQNFVRSVNDQPIHFSDHLYSSNYQKGKEALIDCLLLSKCDHLIYPLSSSLSHVATYFNPFMQITGLHGDLPR